MGNGHRYVVAVGLVAVLSAAMAAMAGAKYNSVVDIGAPLPAFGNLPGIDGKTLSSGDLKKKAVVLVFLANHCPWVRGMDGDLIALAEHFKGRDVDIVGVSVNRRTDDGLEAMKKHAARVGYNFQYVFDGSQELGRRLGATRTPEYFVFDQNRKLVYMGLIHNSPASVQTDGKVNYTRGKPTEFYVTDAIEAVLSGKPVANPETRPQGCTIEYNQAAR